MIDREKVIDWIGKCESQFIGCSLAGKCPYWTDKPDEYCWDRLMHDAAELLNTDQYYLQKLTERLQTIADYPEIYGPTTTVKELKHLVSIMRDIAIRGLPEVKEVKDD